MYLGEEKCTVRYMKLWEAPSRYENGKSYVWTDGRTRMEGRRALHVLKQQVRELLVPQDHLPDETDFLPQSGFIPNQQNN